MPSGAAIQLDPSIAPGDRTGDESDWCSASEVFAGAVLDRGSPGEPNDPCTETDTAVDTD